MEHTQQGHSDLFRPGAVLHGHNRAQAGLVLTLCHRDTNSWRALSAFKGMGLRPIPSSKKVWF
jgi:hypothetical protein